MKKREADFGLTFRHWLKANPMESAWFELKQTTRESIAFSAVKERQIDYALAISQGDGVLIRVQGTNGEPDYGYAYKMPAYIVIKYPGEFFLIPIGHFIRARDDWDGKTLTRGQARILATHAVKIGTPIKKKKVS